MNDCFLLQPPVQSFRGRKSNFLSILEWERLGHCNILVAAKMESFWKVKEASLPESGLFYSQFIMDIGKGSQTDKIHPSSPT
jgi:hypothetical protein